MSLSYINETLDPNVFAEKKPAFATKHNFSHSEIAELQETKDDFAIM